MSRKTRRNLFKNFAKKQGQHEAQYTDYFYVGKGKERQRVELVHGTTVYGAATRRAMRSKYQPHEGVNQK